MQPAENAISVEGAGVTHNADALAMYDSVLKEAITTLVLAQRKLAWAANLDIQYRFTGTGTGSNPLPTAVSALDLVIDRAKAGL